MLRSIEPFRTTTLLTFVIGLAEVVWLYSLSAHTPEARDRIPVILDSLAIHALGLFVLSGLMGLLLIWRLSAGAIPGVVAGAFASLAVLDTGLLAKVIPVSAESGPQYLPVVLSAGVVAVGLGMSRRRLTKTGAAPTIESPT